MNHKRLILPAFLTATLLTVVYAMIVAQRPIPSSIRIQPVYGIEVLDTDHVTALESIDFGVLHRGTDKQVPLPFPPGYLVVNTGEADIWISFNVDGFPNNCTISLAGGIFGDLQPGQIDNTVLSPGADSGDFYFWLDIGDNAPYGNFTATITFNAHDSPTG